MKESGVRTTYSNETPKDLAFTASIVDQCQKSTMEEATVVRSALPLIGTLGSSSFA
jgi:hypothetical protein